MGNKWNKKITSWLLCMMLILAMAFTTVGCGAQGTDGNNQPSSAEVQNTVATQGSVLGEGQTAFPFLVVDKDGNETSFEIHTDKTTVGEALLEVGLIEGEAGKYGLYVKKVNGITADYDADKTYWAFYINGEYASSGVDTTTIEEDATYTFKIEK